MHVLTVDLTENRFFFTWILKRNILVMSIIILLLISLNSVILYNIHEL